MCNLTNRKRFPFSFPPLPRQPTIQKPDSTSESDTDGETLLHVAETQQLNFFERMNGTKFTPILPPPLWITRD